VYLVGAGPGDPGLLTCKAFQLLQKAGVVIYDRLVSAEVLSVANPNALFIFAGKLQGEQERIQTEINGHLLTHASADKVVVRLKGGDPMVFGRGAEEWAFLNKHGIDVELVPGISSSLALPALSGIPVTLRGVATSFAVIAGHRQNLKPQEWSRYLMVDTLVLLMAVENRAAIAANLIRAGRNREEPVAFIERGATDRQRVVTSTLSEVARGQVDVESPAVFVIGQVVGMRRHLRRLVKEAIPVREKEAIHAGH
jgi:uroporphyrin-III C-methyltransferase